MQTVGEIIRQRRESLGLTQTALAKQVGITKGYLSMIENHRVDNPPSRPHLHALERALRITDGELQRAADWQITPASVRAKIERLAQKTEQTQDLARWLKAKTGRRRDGAKSLDELYKSGELTKRINALLASADRGEKTVDGDVPVRYQVPLINRVAAGYPDDFTDLDYPARVADEYVPCPQLADVHAFAARVVGDSMLPDYKEGDIVVFSPAAQVTNGCDCFVRLEPDHQTTFKRVFFDGEKADHIRLQPLNPKFPPTTLDRNDIAGLYRAVWRFQQL
jgi:repressor LexA